MRPALVEQAPDMASALALVRVSGDPAVLALAWALASAVRMVLEPV
jgi:hypothetical protein